MKTLILYPRGNKNESIIIPKEVESIGTQAFVNIQYLKSISFESGSALKTLMASVRCRL